MSYILGSDKPDLAESQNIFNRILERDLYRFVDYKVIDWPHQDLFRDNVTPKKIYDSVVALGTASELQESDIIVDFAEMHYGKKERNPLDFMRFYSKIEPDVCREAGQGCYSNLMPRYFAELLMRIYTKKAEYAELIQEGYNAILSRLQKEPLPEDVDASRNVVSTPPATKAPMTPKPSGSGLHSRNTSYTFVGVVGTPFEHNKFTALKNRSVSPTRSGVELELGSTPATSPSPSPAPAKRKRADEVRQDEGSPKKTKKRR